MKCSICNKKNNKLYTCEECSSKFCPNCGDNKREWCNLCLQFEETNRNNDSIDT